MSLFEVCPVPVVFIYKEDGDEMPRTGRRISSTGYYHVMARGINHEQTFRQAREKNNFKRLLEKFSKKYEVEIYAYCIMPTHIHLLIKSEIQVLSAFMAIVLSEYAEYYNYKKERNGHVFQNRFKSECIEDERYFWNCIQYIHMNPVKANLAKNVSAYKYSSIQEYRTEQIKILHERAIGLYKKQFDQYENYLKFHDNVQNQLFIDVKEELWQQKQAAAFSIFSQMGYSKSIENPKEIIENKMLREEFKESLKEILKITKKEANDLYLIVKSSIIFN